MSPEQLLEAIRKEGIPNARIDEALNREHPAGSRLMGGKRQLKATEIEPLTKLLHQWRKERKAVELAMLSDPEVDEILASIHADEQKAKPAPKVEGDRLDENGYVGVRKLPMYGGMGGGGIGEVLKDDQLETLLMPRGLIEDMLHGRASDFIWIRVRGDSMEPDFKHDDELICDLRDVSPMQPGPFALFHEDGYYVKNVERTTDGRVRIFSSNPKYTAVEEASEHTRIIGRPVWFGRRL